MPLVEIITHEGLDPKYLAALYNWVLSVRKTPVVVKDGPGFLVNRILATFLNEAGHMLEEGVPIADIDQACLDFGMPMGACRLMDEVGLDVSYKVGKILFDGLGDRFKPGQLSQQLVDKGFLGKKSGKGFYIYGGDSDGEINPDVLSILPSESKILDSSTLQMRLILPMVNEAANCLADGIVDSAEDIDLALIYGIGFPPFRGGLMKYADQQGIGRIAGALERFAAEVSADRFKLSEYLLNMKNKGLSFYA